VGFGAQDSFLDSFVWAYADVGTVWRIKVVVDCGAASIKLMHLAFNQENTGRYRGGPPIEGK